MVCSAPVKVIPPADDGVINGTIMDAWQVPLEYVGPAGVDKGKGGKYLILPPDYKGTPPSGYIALPSMNYQGYALLRSILRSGSDADVAKAVLDDFDKELRWFVKVMPTDYRRVLEHQAEIEERARQLSAR